MAWCTECKKDFPEGTQVCPDCGELLEPSAPRPEGCDGNCDTCALHCQEEEGCTGDCDEGVWPSYDDGSPVKPVRLMTVTGTQLDYQMVITQLQSFGVPVVGTFTADGALSKLIFGFAGSGMDVLVPETMADLARELMKPVEDEEA
ncbi:MAG: hypothetical protein IKP17_02250 [Oscillospiraceae bacterium]|nr:hypothetical protein [Oscillospiraceae bacterium]